VTVNHLVVGSNPTSGAFNPAGNGGVFVFVAANFG
jgi:hypothetical protein